LLDCRGRVPRAVGALVEAQRRRQRRELRGGDPAQPGERRVGAEAGAEGRHGGGAAEEAVGEQAAHGIEGTGHEADPAPQPADAAATLRASPAVATAFSSSASVPGSRAARQSGRRLNVVWLSGQYQRAIRVPGGVLRA